MWLAGFSAEFLFSQPKLNKKFGWGVYRLVTGTRRSDHITPVLRQLHWLPLRQRVDFKVATLVHRSLSGISPSHLADDCRLVADARERRLRSAANWTCIVTRTWDIQHLRR